MDGINTLNEPSCGLDISSLSAVGSKYGGE